jgi:hypothetical protein
MKYLTFIVEHWAAISSTLASVFASLATLSSQLNRRKMKGLALQLNGVLTVLLEAKEKAGIEKGRELQKAEHQTTRAARPAVPPDPAKPIT